MNSRSIRIRPCDPGTYKLTFKTSAVYRGVTYTKYAYATLVINPPPDPCFSVDVHARKTIKAGRGITFFTTVVKWCEGYTGDVTLSVDEDSLPPGVNVYVRHQSRIPHGKQR